MTTIPHRISQRPARPRGFTIVEMLVVIGIIVTLIGLLLAGLQAASRTSRKVGQLNDLRQTYIAWSAYAGTYGDYVLPGRLDTRTQTKWRVKYAYRTGGQVNQGLAVHYPFRLMAYLDWNFSPLYGYFADFDEWYPPDAVEANVVTEAADRVSHHPAFGYNGNYIGGHWSTDASGNTTLQFANDQWQMDADGSGATAIPVRGKLVARTLGNITQPSNMVTFCSSTHRDPGIYKSSSEFQAGADSVLPHIFAGEQIWAPYIGATGAIETAAASLAAPRTLAAAFGPLRLEVFVGGSIPFGRFDSAIAVLHADGNTTNVTIPDLLDQRKWINCAIDGMGRPTDFTHTTP